MAREIKSIHLNYSIEKTHGHGQGLGEQGDKTGTEGGKNAIGWGNKIHLDATPTLSDGHVMQGNNTGNPANDDPAWKEIPKVNDGYLFIEWSWDGQTMGGPVSIGSLADNYGCTPSIKANKQDEDKQRHELKVWMLYAKDTPQQVKTHELVFAID